MLPAIVFVIPLFVLFSRMDIVNTLPGLILGDMTFTVPFALVMLGAYLREFPYQLVEAALVDGAGQWRAFFFLLFFFFMTVTMSAWLFLFLFFLGRSIFLFIFIYSTWVEP